MQDPRKKRDQRRSDPITRAAVFIILVGIAFVGGIMTLNYYYTGQGFFGKSGTAAKR